MPIVISPEYLWIAESASWQRFFIELTNFPMIDDTWIFFYLRLQICQLYIVGDSFYCRKNSRVIDNKLLTPVGHPWIVGRCLRCRRLFVGSLVIKCPCLSDFILNMELICKFAKLGTIFQWIVPPPPLIQPIITIPCINNLLIVIMSIAF